MRKCVCDSLSPSLAPPSPPFLAIHQTSVKILASGKAPDMTPAIGILVSMTSDNPIQRGVMMDTKPAPLPNLIAALADESASLRAAACGKALGHLRS